jgi:cytochrome c oxidase cbb3-type subunit 1
LAYTFVESVAQMHPFYAMRAMGGLIFWLGACVMLFNITVTIRKAIANSSAKTAAIANATI